MRNSLKVLVAVMALLCQVYAITEYPLFNQCDSQWGSLRTPHGGSLCANGSFLTSLAAGLRALRVSSRLSSERVPEYTPARLLEWVSTESSCRHARSRAEALAKAQPDTVVPSFVESVSRYLHYQGVATADTACDSILTDGDSFFLGELAGPLQSVVLAVGCGRGKVHVHHPTAGAMSVAPGDLTLHEFSVAYSDMEMQNNLHRQQGLPLVHDFGSGFGDFPTSARIPMNFTGFKQCDSRWAQDKMADLTVCAVGCLMNSVSSALNGHGIRFRNKKTGDALQVPNPGTVNQWLRENGGYDSGSNFIHASIIGMCKSGSPTACAISLPSDFSHKQPDIPISQVKTRLGKYTAMVANVKNGRHFVLAVGWDASDPDRVYVRDSGTPGRDWFSLKNDIVGWRLYNIRGPKTPKSVSYEDLDAFEVPVEREVDMEELAAMLGL